jgi:hypothetical protein
LVVVVVEVVVVEVVPSQPRVRVQGIVRAPALRAVAGGGSA